MLALLLLAAAPLGAQNAAKPRMQARGVPAAAPVAAFAQVDPVIESGASGRAVYPAGDDAAVPAMVYHGARPGPVIAYLFHGFTSPEAFYAEIESTFVSLTPDTMQGTVLVLSLPARADCAPDCAPDPDAPWAKLAPGLLDATRFLVELHQHPAKLADFQPHAFVYLPSENARLATYVKALASAALIGNVVELREGDIEADHAEHLAARSVALEQPALNIESPALENNTSTGAAQLRKGLVNLLHHLKMVPGAVGWQNAVKRLRVDQLPAGFFGKQ